MADSRLFPNLDTYRQTSPATPAYNCIAWAAEDSQRFWWPHPQQIYHWPGSVRREEKIERFIEAFQTLGYEPCGNGTYEGGWQKVVIYVASDGTPTHMARQLENGEWTSKLGNDVDITHHTVEDLEGPLYGTATRYLRRRTPGGNIVSS